MDYDAFYAQLFAPIRSRIGPLDAATLMAIVGFDAGGPVSLSTVHHGDPFCTYVTCELAVRDEQQRGPLGGYELMMTSNDERWTHEILTNLAQMTLETVFDDGHTIDIAPWVEDACRIRALVFETFASVKIDSRHYGILRAIGVTEDELAFARDQGVDELLGKLKAAGVYPKTDLRRTSTLRS